MSTSPRKATTVTKADAPRRFVFLLLDKFTMINFAGAIEPLRLANHVMGYPVYTWALAGEGGVEKTCSNGATFKVDFGLDEVDREDTILVCGGIDIQKTTTKGVISWLRREARRGVAIGGLCTGAHALGTAGGISLIDLMLRIIASDHGEDLANNVADLMIYSPIRTDQDTQRLSIPTRIGVRHPN